MDLGCCACLRCCAAHIEGAAWILGAVPQTSQVSRVHVVGVAEVSGAVQLLSAGLTGAPELSVWLGGCPGSSSHGGWNRAGNS